MDHTDPNVQHVFDVEIAARRAGLGTSMPEPASVLMSESSYQCAVAYLAALPDPVPPQQVMHVAEILDQAGAAPAPRVKRAVVVAAT